MGEAQSGKREFRIGLTQSTQRTQRAIAWAMSAILAVGFAAVAVFDRPGVVMLGPSFALGMLGVAWWWKRGRIHGDQLIVARDRWRYVRSTEGGDYEVPVIGYDRRSGKVIVMPGLQPEQWGIPGVEGDEAGAEQRRWLAETVLKRARRVDDALLQLPSFAAVRARLGVSESSASPFRADGGALTKENASSLLDDRSASRAELVAASVVLMTGGGDEERRRVLSLAEDCEEKHFVALLRAIALGGDVEAAWSNLRTGQPRPTRSLSPVRERLDRLCLVAIVSMLALWRAPSIELLRSLAPGLAIVALLGEARRHLHARGLLKGGEFSRVAHRSGYAYGSALAAAIGAAVIRSFIPVAIVPVLLFAAFWGVQIPWGRRREAEFEGELAEAGRASPETAPKESAAPAAPSTSVRVVLDAPEGEPHEVHAQREVAQEHTRRGA